jgi:RNA recognition motif-containing protein
MNNRLHVGNLAAETTAVALAELFGRDGRKVTNVQLVMTRDWGRSRGFCFVDMATDADAAAAVTALHGATVDGRQLRVSIAHPPKSRFGGRHGGRPAGPGLRR